jgi:3-dehydroquinate dehydratase-2
MRPRRRETPAAPARPAALGILAAPTQIATGPPASGAISLRGLGFPFAREVPIKRDTLPGHGAGPSMAKTVYVLNGPNLNLLGTREPNTYGRATLGDVERLCREAAGRRQLAIEFRQSNHEGEIVDSIHEAAAKQAAGIVINAGAYTHTSVAIRDAIAAIAVPVIEVHISNVFARESFRHHSHIAPVAKASLCGFGIEGYALAIEGLAAMIDARQKG